MAANGEGKLSQHHLAILPPSSIAPPDGWMVTAYGACHVAPNSPFVSADMHGWWGREDRLIEAACVACPTRKVTLGTTTYSAFSPLPLQTLHLSSCSSICISSSGYLVCFWLSPSSTFSFPCKFDVLCVLCDKVMPLGEGSCQLNLPPTGITRITRITKHPS